MTQPHPELFAFEPELSIELPHGRCVGLRIPDALDEAALSALAPEERAHLAGLGPRRRRTFWGGRRALRRALLELGADTDRAGAAIAADDRGAPLAPDGFCGSISHKDDVAVALAAPEEPGVRIGVDVEVPSPARLRIERLVLTDAERAALDREAREGGPLSLEGAPERWPMLVLRFSLKEALYKALDPFVRRWVGFKEVEAWPLPDGGATLTLARVREREALGLVAEGSWRVARGLILTSARVSSRRR